MASPERPRAMHEARVRGRRGRFIVRVHDRNPRRACLVEKTAADRIAVLAVESTC
ncbi:MAG TPA: hypothetical protein PLM09_19460 [Casimicrobiaceae bacterium]|nr:hypothetical protein [Casimicrobiaceae bacterium]